jgi:hypothetical protein
MMRGKLITGLESQRDARAEAVMVSPAFPTPALKKLLDVALHMFENVRSIFGCQRKFILGGKRKR